MISDMKRGKICFLGDAFSGGSTVSNSAFDGQREFVCEGLIACGDRVAGVDEPKTVLANIAGQVPPVVVVAWLNDGQWAAVAVGDV